MRQNQQCLPVLPVVRKRVASRYKPLRGEALGSSEVRSCKTRCTRLGEEHAGMGRKAQALGQLCGWGLWGCPSLPRWVSGAGGCCPWAQEMELTGQVSTAQVSACFLPAGGGSRASTIWHQGCCSCPQTSPSAASTAGVNKYSVQVLFSVFRSAGER